MPIPVSATLSSNFSGVSIGRTYSPKRSGAISSIGSAAGSASVDETEQRQPDVLVLLEDNLDLLAQFQLLSVAFDDVGGQPHPRVFGDGDLGDDIGSGQTGHAESMVDGESGQRGPAGHRPNRQVVRAAVAAHRCGWMDQRSAVGAFLQPQLSVRT